MTLDELEKTEFHEPQSGEQPLLLTGDEAAARFRVSVRTWRSWDAAGRVPRPINIGRTKLWRPLELVDWVAAGCPPRARWEWEPRVSQA